MNYISALKNSSFYNVSGGFALATVASPDMISGETGKNEYGSHPKMLKVRLASRLLRGQGRSFQLIEAPRGRPYGGDNSKEGNTTPSQSAGAVQGDRHCPPP